MSELLTQYWIPILVALIIGIAVAWFVFAANRKTRVELERKPEDGPSEPARRNQALIDAPPAAAAPEMPPATPQGLAGAGVAVAAAVQAHELEQGAAERQADDLTRLKGVGPKLSALLHSLGITSFEQIAGWTAADMERVDAQLGNFQGRITRDNWVEQARLLAEGDTEGFEGRFGKL